jgi:hypothetical protein
MNKSLQGRFREAIHNNYTLYYFVYMYSQICDEYALIWGFPDIHMWRGLNRTANVWQILRSPRVIKITVFVILEKK